MDKGTYGFGRADAEALANLIGSVEVETPRRPLRTVGGDGGSQSFGFEITTGMTSREGLATIFAMADVENATSIASNQAIKCRAFFGDLPAGTKGQCELHGDVYIVTNAACPPEVIIEDPEE